MLFFSSSSVRRCLISVIAEYRLFKVLLKLGVDMVFCCMMYMGYQSLYVDPL